jgi:trehalose synthase
MDEIAIHPRPIEQFEEVLDAEQFAQFRTDLDAVREQLTGHRLWHVSSTAEGGGVAEMLQSILGYPLGCDVPIHWLVIDGSEEFFDVTKRLHHLLHGSPGDGGSLGEHERHVYESALAADTDEALRRIQPGDAIILHDPQTLGLAPALSHAGAHVVWNCHIGADRANEETRSAWRFLAPYTVHTARQVFSRHQYGWENLESSRIAVVPPCIDAFSPKNQELEPDTVAAILDAAGLIPAGSASAAATFVRRDESTGRVATRVEMVEDEPVPVDAKVVIQVSRWDPLKDHNGVMTGFCEHGPAELDAHLVLAGPSPESITDDPEGAQTLADLQTAWRALPPPQRRLVHLACLPMSDVDENAAIVNALQRRADVVVQKSLAEGFGLTVAESMWKERPTVGSRVGGIQDQIEDGESGVLVEPEDLREFGAAVAALLHDRDRATALGREGHERVRHEYLPSRHLSGHFRLLGEVMTSNSSARRPARDASTAQR